MESKILQFLIYLSFLLSISVSQSGIAQCYVQLEDVSGYTSPTATNDLAELEAAACELIDILPVEFQTQFKVYDFGFYRHHETTEGGFPEAMQLMVQKVEALSPYYLLFGRQSDSDGIYTKIWIELNVPTQEEIPCFTETRRSFTFNRIIQSVNDYYEEKNRNYPFCQASILKGIQTCFSEFEKTIFCCIPTGELKGSIEKDGETCVIYQKENDINAIIHSIGLGAVTYCAPCGTSDQAANEYDLFEISDGVYKCVFGTFDESEGFELINIEDISITIDQENRIEDVASAVAGNDFIFYDQVLVEGDLKSWICGAKEQYPPDFCVLNPVSEDLEGPISTDIYACIIAENNIEILLDGTEGSITQTKITEYLEGLSQFLSDNLYDVHFAIYDAEQRMLQTVDNTSGIIATEDLSEVVANQHKFINEDYSDGHDVYVWAVYENGKLKLEININHENFNVHSSYTGETQPGPIADAIEYNVKRKLSEVNSYSGSIIPEQAALPIQNEGEFKILDNNVFKFIAFGCEELIYVAEEFRMSPGIWNRNDQLYDEKLIHIYSPMAGVTDQVIEESTDMLQLAELAANVILDPVKAKNDLVQLVSMLTLDNMRALIGNKVDTYTTPGPEQSYYITKDAIAAVIAIITVYKAIRTIAKKASSEGGELLKEFRDFLKEFESKAFKQAINDLSNELKKKFLDDFKGKVDDVKDFFDKFPGGVKAWDVLNSNLDWRGKVGYLKKIVKYTDADLVITKKGDHFIVNQADGLEIGKLDVDILEDIPGDALKVKGNNSRRHFDPHDAGGSIVRKSWTNVSIDQSGIDDISTHLSRFTQGATSQQLQNNSHMMARLNQIKSGQLQATDFDKRFYTHELEEFSRYKNKGIPNGEMPGNSNANFHENAHSASLESYSIFENDLPLYHPSVPNPDVVPGL